MFGVFRPLPDDPIGKVDAGSKAYLVEMNDPPPYPCAMVRPETGTLVWVVDAEAAKEQMAV